MLRLEGKSIKFDENCGFSLFRISEGFVGNLGVDPDLPRKMCAGLRSAEHRTIVTLPTSLVLSGK